MVTSYDSSQDTLEHMEQVKNILCSIINELSIRSALHDRSKLSPAEKPYFDIYTPKLKNTTYGSEEYNKYLSELQVALDHHYKYNRHHPEHFENGVNDMTIIDLIEMFCDWSAATLRHKDGDLTKSIEYNQKRFGLSDQLTKIFLNSVRLMK